MPSSHNGAVAVHWPPLQAPGAVQLPEPAVQVAASARATTEQRPSTHAAVRQLGRVPRSATQVRSALQFVLTSGPASPLASLPLARPSCVASLFPKAGSAQMPAKQRPLGQSLSCTHVAVGTAGVEQPSQPAGPAPAHTNIHAKTRKNAHPLAKPGRGRRPTGMGQGLNGKAIPNCAGQGANPTLYRAGRVASNRVWHSNDQELHQGAQVFPPQQWFFKMHVVARAGGDHQAGLWPGLLPIARQIRVIRVQLAGQKGCGPRGRGCQV